MHQSRFIALSTIFCGIFCAPLFTFAQTATTTQAQQPTSELQQQIDQLINDKIRLIPTETAIRAGALSNYLEIKTTPQNPGPLESVQVSIQSYLTDLNKATISWTLDGRLIERGVGRKTFVFQNGASGKTTRLSIAVTTNAGEYFTKNLSWTPLGVTTLWEADTYAPPFYKGKALPTAQAAIKAVALPDSSSGQNALNAGNYVYVWEKDGSTVADASGYGKNYFSFTAPKPYGTAGVKVQVSSMDDTMKSETRINLSLSQPFILFYEKSPLLGTWYNQSFGTDLTLNRKEFSISAEPYFFSNETSETPNLKYDWAVNNKATENYGRTITLRNDTNAEGDSIVSLAMRSLKQTFQSSNQILRVHFKANTPSASRPAF